MIENNLLETKSLGTSKAVKKNLILHPKLGMQELVGRNVLREKIAAVMEMFTIHCISANIPTVLVTHERDMRKNE